MDYARSPGLLLSTLLVALVACSHHGSNEPDGAPFDAHGDLADANTSSDFGTPQERIIVRAYPSWNEIELGGAFHDSPLIEPRVESQRIGACRLMAYTPSFCDPICDPGELCIDEQCKSQPERVNRGAIEWRWPGAHLTVQPDATNYYQGSGACSTHGEVTVTVEETTLRANTTDGPAPIEDWGEVIGRRSDDVVLQWSNPEAGARVRLFMTDCAGSHGAIGEYEIECEGPDTGELAIAGAFLDELEAGDWSHGECGSHTLVRYRIDSAGENAMRLETWGATSFFYRPDW